MRELESGNGIKLGFQIMADAKDLLGEGIRGTVGRTELNAQNQKDDVLLVQSLLKHAAASFKDKTLDPKGASGSIKKNSKESNTIKAMQAFQAKMGRNPTGLFRPRGVSITQLLIIGTPIAWGVKVSPQFKLKLYDICAELGIDPNHLMACIALETSKTFSPRIQNPKSKATGLIQFTKTTAKALGTTVAALAAMTAEKQLDYVRLYFLPWKGKLRSLLDIYLVIFSGGKGVGKSKRFKVYTKEKHGRAYSNNDAYDKDGDGDIELQEIDVYIRRFYSDGFNDSNLG